MDDQQQARRPGLVAIVDLLELLVTLRRVLGRWHSRKGIQPVLQVAAFEEVNESRLIGQVQDRPALQLHDAVRHKANNEYQDSTHDSCNYDARPHDIALY